MSAHDRYLANYSRTPVEVTCKRCDVEPWLDFYEFEYGAGWLVIHEECPKCGASGEELEVSDTNPDDWDPRNEYDPDRDHNG